MRFKRDRDYSRFRGDRMAQWGRVFCGARVVGSQYLIVDTDCRLIVQIFCVLNSLLTSSTDYFDNLRHIYQMDLSGDISRDSWWEEMG